MNARLIRSGRERGASAVIIAILLPVVLLGLGAIVIDVGAFYAERAQTQNGADAGAVAVAQTCAKGTCVGTAADNYAPVNSNGTISTTSEVTRIAGNQFPCVGNVSDPAVANSLPTCNPALENALACPKARPAGKPYVDVMNNTRNTSTGTTLVPDFLGKALAGSSYAGRTIAACSQASWGPPSGLSGAVALTISACEWLKNTNDGKAFATIPTGTYSAGSPFYTSPPSYLATLNTRRGDADYYDASLGGNYYVKSNLQDPHTPVLNAPVAGSETVITTHGFGNSCAQGNPGWAAPGQFGWLSKSTCQVPIDGTSYQGTTGNTPAPCGPIFLDSLQNKKPIYLPVYTTVTDNGTNTTFTLDGFAAFVVTGWDVGGGVNQWNLNGSNVPTRMDSAVELADASPSSSLSAAKKIKDAHYCNDFTQKTGNSDVCIYGYFTQALIPASALPTDGGGTPSPNLGATSAFLTG